MLNEVASDRFLVRRCDNAEIDSAFAITANERARNMPNTAVPRESQ
jgi:hypothetical protein